MSHKDDRFKNSLMNENFVVVVAEGRKLPQHKYKHCEYQFTKGAAREQQHLKLTNE
jgi:uncharacterized protein with FMN-binding domain